MKLKLGTKLKLAILKPFLWVLKIAGSLLAVYLVFKSKPTKKGITRAVMITIITMIIKDPIPYVDELACMVMVLLLVMEYKGNQDELEQEILLEEAKSQSKQETQPIRNEGNIGNAQQPVSWTKGE